MKWTWLFILMLLFPTVSAVSYPELHGFVTDNANMIDQPYEAKITQLAQQIEKESTVEIEVVTIESLEGESIELYAVKLFEKWGVGKKDKDNGLLIIVAKQERDYRFEVGYGLEGTVTDSMKVNIGDRIIVPNFRNGEYGKGIYESMLVVQELIRGNPEVVSQYSMKQGGGTIEQSSSEDFAILFIILFFLIVGFIIFIAIMNTTNSRSPSDRKRYGGVIFGGGFGGGRYGGGGFGGGFGGGRHGGGGFGGGFGGFGGGRSGGGGFGGKW